MLTSLGNNPYPHINTDSLCFDTGICHHVWLYPPIPSPHFYSSFNYGLVNEPKTLLIQAPLNSSPSWGSVFQHMSIWGDILYTNHNTKKLEQWHVYTW